MPVCGSRAVRYIVIRVFYLELNERFLYYLSHDSVGMSFYCFITEVFSSALCFFCFERIALHSGGDFSRGFGNLRRKTMGCNNCLFTRGKIENRETSSKTAIREMIMYRRYS